MDFSWAEKQWFSFSLGVLKSGMKGGSLRHLRDKIALKKYC